MHTSVIITIDWVSEVFPQVLQTVQASDKSCGTVERGRSSERLILDNLGSPQVAQL